jgi:hypothetical protein
MWECQNHNDRLLFALTPYFPSDWGSVGGGQDGIDVPGIRGHELPIFCVFMSMAGDGTISENKNTAEAVFAKRSGIRRGNEI